MLYIYGQLDGALRMSLDKLLYFPVGCRLDDHVFTCGPHVIKQSASVKDLRVMFSNYMSLREHYNYVCKKDHGLCAKIFRAFETRDMRFLIDRPVQNICETSARVCFACMVSTFKSGHYFNRESAAHVYETYTISASFNVCRKIVFL